MSKGRNAFWKDINREIWNTRNRFLCIFLIVALGVAFFSGIRATEPDMQKSADRFFDENNLMDIRVVSTLGLTSGDADAIKAVPGVKEVAPNRYVDAIQQVGETQNVIRVSSIPKTINKVALSEGRMPESDDECIVDSKLTNHFSTVKLGDVISLTDDSEGSLGEKLENASFKVVGIVTTPLYLSFERESSSIGSGTVTGFIMVNEKNFKLDYYTDIYVTVDGALELTAYTDEYKETVDEIVTRIEEIADERCTIRRDGIVSDAQMDIDDAQKELDEKTAEANEKLDDAAAKIADAHKQIDDSELTIADAKKKLEDGRKELEEGERELTAKANELAEGWDEYNRKLSEYTENRKLVDEKSEELYAMKAELEDKHESVQNALAALEGLTGAGASTQRALLSSAEAEIEDGLKQVEAGLAELEKARAALKNGAAQLEEGHAKLVDGEARLEEGRAELEKGRQEILDAEKEIADGEKELSEGKETLASSEKEYEEKRLEAETEIADANQKLDDARKEVQDIKEGSWYVLDRDFVQVLAEYGENSNRIGAIGEVFPVIFFLVAILVSLTTMTRMVEEQRTQIGTMKALGYGKNKIAIKYLLYALYASVGGSILGVIIGEKLLPYVIIAAYKILYNNLPYVLNDIDIWLGVKAGLIASACTVGAAYLALRNSLRQSAAELMRPVAPKPGKRVLIERIGFIWKHLNFSNKSTIRNLFRYKKRLFMTLFGIAGCMALLLVGFGLHDSIYAIVDNQYGVIIKYNGNLSSSKDATDEQLAEIESKLDNNSFVKDYMRVCRESFDAGAGKGEKNLTVVVASDPDKFTDYITLRSRTSKESYSLEESGNSVIVTEKLTKLLDIEEGDEFYLKNADNVRFNVGVRKISENYISNFVYITPSQYREIFEKEPEFTEYLILEESTDKAAEDEFAKEMLCIDGVNSITFNTGFADQVHDMMSSLDFVVYVLILSAALLAFVVLYNLNNININERRRELATIKVLGFFDGEVTAYMGRENVILTVLGTALGVVLGFFLHRYVIVTSEIDMTMFGREISLLSYCLAVLMTFLFSAFVNFVMHFKLKKIDMASSLKSIE